MGGVPCRFVYIEAKSAHPNSDATHHITAATTCLFKMDGCRSGLNRCLPGRRHCCLRMLHVWWLEISNIVPLKNDPCRISCQNIKFYPQLHLKLIDFLTNIRSLPDEIKIDISTHTRKPVMMFHFHNYPM